MMRRLRVNFMNMGIRFKAMDPLFRGRQMDGGVLCVCEDSLLVGESGE